MQTIIIAFIYKNKNISIQCIHFSNLIYFCAAFWKGFHRSKKNTTIYSVRERHVSRYTCVTYAIHFAKSELKMHLFPYCIHPASFSRNYPWDIHTLHFIYVCRMGLIASQILQYNFRIKALLMLLDYWRQQ